MTTLSRARRSRSRTGTPLVEAHARNVLETLRECWTHLEGVRQIDSVLVSNTFLACAWQAYDDCITGETITFTDGAAAGQTARVTAYTGADNYAIIAVYIRDRI